MAHAHLLQPEIVSEPNRRTPPIELLAGARLASYSSENTRRAYRSDLRAWLTFGDHHDLPPLEARRSHVELFVRQLEQLGRAPATVARRLCGVSRWYAWLVDEEYLEYSPTIRVNRP